MGVESQLLPGVGFASLQRGSSRNRTALAIYYGYYQGHSLFDRLPLDLYSWRHALTPDFGYPETADSYDPRRLGFLSHTVAHNTMMGNSRFSTPILAHPKPLREVTSAGLRSRIDPESKLGEI